MKFLDNVPRVQPHLTVSYAHDNSTVFFISEHDSLYFEDEVLCNLIPLINGQRTVKEIVLLLKDKHPFTEIVGKVNDLHQRKLVTYEADVLPENESAYWSTNGLTQPKLKERHISLKLLGKIDITKWDSVWQHHGIVLKEGNSDLTVVVTDDYLHPELEKINLEATRPWLLVKPIGTMIWLGPLFVPGNSACWACLAQRLQHNQAIKYYATKSLKPGSSILQGHIPTTLDMGLSMAATQIIHWLAGDTDSHPLLNSIVTLDVKTLDQTVHKVTQRPQCAVCGELPLNSPEPVKLKPRLKADYCDGGSRSDLPDTVFKRYEHHISPITGIVPTLRPLTDDGVSQVFDAGNRYIHGHMHLDWNQWLPMALQNRAGGKGVTAKQSKISGLGEALERYSAWYDGTESERIASYNELGSAAVHPNTCMGYSDYQYQNRDTLNKLYKNSGAPGIPKPFDETEQLAWTPIWSMKNQEWKYAPMDLCYIGYPQLPNKRFCTGDSNGCAAGASLEDAILQGLFELIERDSMGIWWLNRLRRPGFSLVGIDDEYISALKQIYANYHRNFWAIDITSDLGIPTIAAISSRIDEGASHIILGVGAHFDASIALMRAITEMNQSLPTAIRGFKEKLPNLPVAESLSINSNNP